MPFHTILEALKPNQRISHIFVTHTHLDHSPLAAPLSVRTGAPVLAFGGPQAGRCAVMSNLARQVFAGGGEGIDSDFLSDVELADGEKIATDSWELEAIHTPGHLGNHIALVLHFSINAKNYQPYASFYYRVKLREFGSGVFSCELPVAL